MGVEVSRAYACARSASVVGALLALGAFASFAWGAPPIAPPAAPIPAPPPAPPPGSTLADPWLEHGLSNAAREDLRRRCLDAVAREDVAGGALLVAHRGEVIFREAFGMADRTTKRAFTVDTPCRIASISKAFLATLCARLATRGVLDLEAPIDRWLPEFHDVKLVDGRPSPRVPLLRECLSHTAGFRADEAPGGRPWLASRDGSFTLADEMTVLARRGLDRAPGDRFAYSGTGIEVAGRAIEVATKCDLEDAMQEELLGPLALAKTTYCLADDVVSLVPVYHYLWESDGRLHADRSPHVFPAKGQYRSVGGGLVSTLDDVASFLALHRARGALGGEAFIRSDLWRELVTAHEPSKRYGLGWSLESGPKEAGFPSKMRHSGSTGTAAWVDFHHDVVGVILTQGHRVKGGAAKNPARTIAPNEPEFPKVLEEAVDAIVAGLKPEGR